MSCDTLTIGHSTHEVERFCELLRTHAVELLADVRRFPGSRRLPQFNADALATSLARVGIDYEGLGDALGGRRRPRPDSPNGAWRVAGFRGYADHLASEEFAAGLQRLERLAADRRTAFMCAEADWRRCHRRLIADVLVARGWTVIHILRDGSTERHQMPAFARVEPTAEAPRPGRPESRPGPGDISYPPAQPELGA